MRFINHKWLTVRGRVISSSFYIRRIPKWYKNQYECNSTAYTDASDPCCTLSFMTMPVQGTTLLGEEAMLNFILLYSELWFSKRAQ